MAGRDEAPEFVVDFPTLFVAVDWVEQHCVIPDGFRKGRPFVPYRVASLVSASTFTGSSRTAVWMPGEPDPCASVSLPPRSGRPAAEGGESARYTAAHICVEAVGPALFAGWAERRRDVGLP